VGLGDPPYAVMTALTLSLLVCGRMDGWQSRQVRDQRAQSLDSCSFYCAALFKRVCGEALEKFVYIIFYT
jgi:hypothetical protein